MAQKTIKQKLAQERNWTKARLMGGITGLTNGTFSNPEKLRVQEAVDIILGVLKDWDENSKILGLNPLPIYQVVDRTSGKIFREGKLKELKVFKDSSEFRIILKK